MHFLLFLLRLVLDRLIPAWRDGLTMAARADGRVEHLPTRSALWDRWLSFIGMKTGRGAREWGGGRGRGGSARLPEQAPGR